MLASSVIDATRVLIVSHNFGKTWHPVSIDSNLIQIYDCSVCHLDC